MRVADGAIASVLAAFSQLPSGVLSLSANLNASLDPELLEGDLSGVKVWLSPGRVSIRALSLPGLPFNLKLLHLCLLFPLMIRLLSPITRLSDLLLSLVLPSEFLVASLYLIGVIELAIRASQPWSNLRAVVTSINL